MKTIRQVVIPTSDLSSAEHALPLKVIGDQGSVFSVIVTKDNKYWYNFDTSVQAFDSLDASQSSAEYKLSDAIIGASGIYSTTINIPSVSSGSIYRVLIVANLSRDTKHVDRLESIDTDGSVNENKSIGSESNVLTRTINQLVNVDLSFVGISFANSGTYLDAAGTSFVVSVPSGLGVATQSFSKTFTLASSDFIKARDPSSVDFQIALSATVLDVYEIGGETYYLIDEDVSNLQSGYKVRHANITNHAVIREVITTGRLGSNSISLETFTGTVTGGDVLKVYLSGDAIARATGTSLSFSNLNISVTDVSTTVNDTDCTGSASLTTFDVASSNGIKDDFSTMHGVNITTPPTVTNISSNTLTVSVAQILQNGQPLTFKGSSRSAVLTGDVNVNTVGDTNLSIFIDLDSILTVS